MHVRNMFVVNNLSCAMFCSGRCAADIQEHWTYDGTVSF